MLKAWKRECNVEMRSICLETVAIFFVNQWQWRSQSLSLYWCDWMVRDFFVFLLRQTQAGWVTPAGITEQIPLGDKWQSKCLSAYNRALKACEYEHSDSEYQAALEWQKIFGSQFKAESPLQKYLQQMLVAAK